MHFPQETYTWLVNQGLIKNDGELNEKGTVEVPSKVEKQFDNGYLIGEIVKKIAVNMEKRPPQALNTVKNDNSKNARLTNWNFIWIAFDAIGVKMDPRVKDLILGGELALIVEVVRQLRERSGEVIEPVTIKSRVGKHKGRTQAVDVKKINLNKDPEESQSSLEFLMLLLRTSLDMTLEEILGLFTNQNKYLAHIIVKGVADNFAPVVLFYSLLNKHVKKLKAFHESDPRDAQACFYAVKPGFISRSSEVANLTAQLFSKLDNIYDWMVGEESKCVSTLLLGLKRHPNLRQVYWHLLVETIEGNEAEFFSKIYPQSFQTQEEMIEITTLLLKFISQSFLGQKLQDMGTVGNWLDIAVGLNRKKVDSQIICFKFIQELMVQLPTAVQNGEQAAVALSRDWKDRTLIDSIPLINELLVTLERLGESKNVLSRKVFLIIGQVAQTLGSGERRDYLVDNFIPLIAKFPTIPSEDLITHLKGGWLTSAEFLLVCQSVEINSDAQTLSTVGAFIKDLFIEDPLVNHALASVLLAIAPKIIEDSDVGVPFLEKLVEEILHLYAGLELKFKHRPKQQALYNGRKGAPTKVHKGEELQQQIKEKWKELLLSFINKIDQLFTAQEADELRQTLKDKIMNCNAHIRLHNHKVGSKALEDMLSKKFGVQRQEQVAFSEEFSAKKAAVNLEESAVRKSKVMSQVSVMHKLKGPENMAKEFKAVIDKRKHEQEEKKAQELKKQLIEERKKLSVKRQMEISNLLRGQVGEAQLRDEGLLEGLVKEGKELEVFPLEELEAREVEATEALLQRYHKVLRHLFLTYTFTMYNGHQNQQFEDNHQRKQILTAVQLLKLLKDYRLSFMTNQHQIIELVRDVNVKLLKRKEAISQLDFNGFEQFLLQYCLLLFTRPHTTTTNSGGGKKSVHTDLRGQPLNVLLKEVFEFIRKTFVSRGQKTSIFDEDVDMTLNDKQAYEIDILHKKLKENPSYILPKGYKKIAEKKVDFQYALSDKISGVSESYNVSYQVMNAIFQKALGAHVMQSISTKNTSYRIKPLLAGRPQLPRERAMSTMIQRKQPPAPPEWGKRRSVTRVNISKAVLGSMKLLSITDFDTGRQVALVLDEMVSQVAVRVDKDKEKKNKILSKAKLEEMAKLKHEKFSQKVKEKEEAKALLAEKERQNEKRRREKADEYMKVQKAKLLESKKQKEEERYLKLQEKQEEEAKKKENQSKFKQFHKSQLQKIKKINEDAVERMKRKEQDELQKRQRDQEMRRRLRQKIEEDDKKIIESKRETQRNIIKLFESQPIQRVYRNFYPVLRSIYGYLLQHTFTSLTQRKHNNELIFDTWRYFLQAFEISPLIVHPRDVTFIFKLLTRDKVVSKDYYVGLNNKDFQQALFRIAIKYKSIFNVIADKIKDVPQSAPPPPQDAKGAKGKGKTVKPKEKPKPVEDDNEFADVAGVNVKQIIKDNHQGKEVDDYGDLTKVTDRTLMGLLYYLKVPMDRAGQQKRFRQLTVSKPTSSIVNTQRLQQKLKEEYTMESPLKKSRGKSPVPTPVGGSLAGGSIKSKKSIVSGEGTGQA